MKWLVGIIIVAVFLCGCATAPPVVARIPFPVAEYEALPQMGAGIVRGQAFLKTRGGDVKTAAGNEVELNPVTSYSLQWYDVYLQGSMIEPADPRIEQYIMKTAADADGRFEFTDVPPGDYFLTTKVIWEAPTGYRGSLVPQGGLITKRITVKDGQEQQIIMTR